MTHTKQTRLPLMAPNGQGRMSDLSPLSGEERKSNFGAAWSVDGTQLRHRTSQKTDAICALFLSGRPVVLHALLLLGGNMANRFLLALIALFLFAVATPP